MSAYRRVLLAVLALGLLASLYVAASRFQKERHSKHVEIAMDFTDFDALSRSYGYNGEQFLVELRRAGLTSVALSEELGVSVGTTSTNAVALSGQSLIAQSRIAPMANPVLARLVRQRAAKASEVYLVVYDPATYRRYLQEIPLHFGAHTLRVLNAKPPYVLAIRTQADFFAASGLGIADEQFALVRRLGLIIDPRVQNDERFQAPEIGAVFNTFAHRGKIGTVIFMGVSNQVVGFPDHLQDTADAFKRLKLRFGAVEWYERTQEQKGTTGLATRIPGSTTRVQAITKAELDKLDPPAIIARYLLGVRERNVRVIYLRPYAHLWEGRSIEATNVEIVRGIAAGLKSRGFTLGTATPVPAFRVNPIVIALASLAVPALFLLVLQGFGLADRRMAIAIFALDLVVIGAGYASHHDMAARKLVALSGAMLFAVSGALAVAGAFRARQVSGTLEGALLDGLRTLAIAVAVATAGGLVVVGLLSTPLTMEEIDRFTGVKAVLVVPPLVILALYWFTSAFDGRLEEPRAFFSSPVRIGQLVLLAVVAGAAFLLLTRSGNQSDITPSTLELALRSHLNAILSVRPRFKEFLIGFPLLMLLPNLIAPDRRSLGWLFALGIGVGLADVVDTFSHLHTPLSVSVTRIVLGAVLGALSGAVAIVLYRRFRIRAV